MKKYCLLSIFLASLSFSFAADSHQVFAFYKQQADALMEASGQADRIYAQALADNLGTWAAQNPTDENTPRALLTQARLYLEAQERARALIVLLKVNKMYPQTNPAAYQGYLTEALTAVKEPARSSYGAQAFRTRLTKDSSPASREADVLYALSKLPGKTLYGPAAQEFESFFVRHPEYEKNDQVELWYGDLHRENDNYLAAISQYQKTAALYPNTPYRAASLRLTGDVYADQLKNTDQAMALYNQVLREYPSSAETGIVYKHMAIVQENNKNYEGALAYYDKAIAHLGTQEAAYEAYQGKTDVYKKMKNYQAAYESAHDTATAFAGKDGKGEAALLEAAQIAKKNLRDTGKYTQSLEKALAAYPASSQAPEVMYSLAQVYEDQGKNAQAVALYKKLVLASPEGKYGAKAQKRILKLEK